jgi:hypothetical protein
LTAKKKSLTQELIADAIASKPEARETRAWYYDIKPDEMDAMVSIWREQRKSGSEVNRAYPAKRDLAKYLCSRFQIKRGFRAIYDRLDELVGAQ